MVGPLVTVFVVIGACVTRVCRGHGFLSCGPPSGETVLVIAGQRRLSNERIPSHPFGGSTRIERRPPRPWPLFTLLFIRVCGVPGDSREQIAAFIGCVCEGRIANEWRSERTDECRFRLKSGLPPRSTKS